MAAGNTPGPAIGGKADMFLLVKGARTGLIKGEAQDTAHANEIDVVSWSWGLQARPTLGGGSASGKSTTRELRVIKRVDSASTALMSALRTNELITRAVLTVRKAGKSPLEYLKITIEQGRVTGLNIEAGDRESRPELTEDVTFSFNKITVEYTPQDATGAGKGATVYMDQFDELA